MSNDEFERRYWRGQAIRVVSAFALMLLLAVIAAVVIWREMAHG